MKAKIEVNGRNVEFEGEWTDVVLALKGLNEEGFALKGLNEEGFAEKTEEQEFEDFDNFEKELEEAKSVVPRRKHRRVNGKHRKSWSKEDDQMLKDFYAQNATANGRLRRGKLKKLRRALSEKRTMIAVKARVKKILGPPEQIKKLVKKQERRERRENRKVQKQLVKQKPWSQDDIVLRKFYADPANHYSDGDVRHDAYKRLSVLTGRSIGALAVRISTLKLKDVPVYGADKKSPQKQHKRQQQKQPVDDVVDEEKELEVEPEPSQEAQVQQSGQRGEFPVLEKVKEQDIARSVLLHIAKMEGHLFYDADAFTFGIDSVPQWMEFCKEVLFKSNEIAKSFGMPNKFKIEREGKQMILKYGDKLY